MRYPFVGESFDAQSFAGNSERSINCMVEALSANSTAKTMLVPTPGIKAFGTMGNSTTGERGCWRMANELYVVYGQSLFKVDSDGTETRLGEVLGTERVIMFDNETQLVIVADEFSYNYSNRTGAFAQITHSSFLEASSGAYLAGYFLFAAKDSNVIFFIGPYDDVTGEVDFDAFDATDRFLARTTAGNTVRIISNQRELWIFKGAASETWRPIQDVDLPFGQIDGATTTQGILTKWAVASFNNTIIWLSHDFQTYIASGYIPTPVSHSGVTDGITRLATTSDAYIYAWDEGDHKLAGLWFKTAGITHLYDFTTDQWHERASQGLKSGKEFWRATCVIRCYGKLLVGDSEGPNLGELDVDTFTEYSNPLKLERVGPTMHLEGAFFSVDRVELFCESGVGLTTGQGADPDVFLEISKDYGETFGNPKPRSLGKKGERRKKLVWRAQGLYRQFTPKVVISDPVRRYILNMYVEVSPRKI